MGRKEDRAELMSVRVMQEQEWAYLARARRLSPVEIARLSIEPPERGGLGYYRSAQQVRGLVNTYAERMRDALEESPALRVEMELADLDMQYRAAAELAGAIDAGATERERRTTGDSEVVVYRDEKIRIAALAQLRAIGESRRKLKGLDEASKVDVTVTTTTDAELAKLAEQLGMPKVARRA